MRLREIGDFPQGKAEEQTAVSSHKAKALETAVFLKRAKPVLRIRDLGALPFCEKSLIFRKERQRDKQLFLRTRLKKPLKQLFSSNGQSPFCGLETLGRCPKPHKPLKRLERNFITESFAFLRNFNLAGGKG